MRLSDPAGGAVSSRVRGEAPILALLLAWTLLLAGCETLGERVGRKFGAAPAQGQSYEADEDRTYAAARIVLEKMGFRALRGNAAQGRIEAVSSIRTDDSFRGARQLEVKISLQPAVGEGTEVWLSISELIEDSFDKGISGRATPVPLTGGYLYEAFFRGLRQELGGAEKE